MGKLLERLKQFNDVDMLKKGVLEFRTILSAGPSCKCDGCLQDDCETQDCHNCYYSTKQYSPYSLTIGVRHYNNLVATRKGV